MWQHGANIIIGLVLTVIALFGILIGVVQVIFAGLFVLAGVAIIVFGIWGLADEFSHEEVKEGGL